tara:strand:- start:368 stop:667 length:300 start_codon:yes stop_codon:yes gene_type:complete
MARKKIKPVNTVLTGGRYVTYVSALPDDIDERVEKIQVRLEELNPEFQAMAEELQQIGWDLADTNRDLWKNNLMHSKVSEFEQLKWLSDWLKDFRINPR